MEKMKQTGGLNKSLLRSTIKVQDNDYNGMILKNYKRNGFGHQDFKNGDTYDGCFRDDMFEGLGLYTYNNGNQYEGNFCKGIKQGKGEYRVKQKDELYDIYKGNFKNGLKEGYFTVFYANGDVFKGKYLKDKKYYGTLTYNTGSEYTGYFNDNKFDGKGVFKKLGEFTYTGQFKNNQRHGWGKEQQGINLIKCPFDEDKPAGKGTIYYEGKVYSGFIIQQAHEHQDEHVNNEQNLQDTLHLPLDSTLPPIDQPSLPGGEQNVNQEENN